MPYRSIKLILVTAAVMLNCYGIYAQFERGVHDRVDIDSLSRKQDRELKIAEMKQSHSRLFVNISYVYAKLNTTASFELPSGLLTAKLGLEENLGLPNVRTFFTGSFIYRITPGSGIYLHYYGINRKKNWELDEDIIFLNDTIHVGIQSTAYFNTQVISAGYLFAILKDPQAFLGAYLNVYVMMLNTGIKSNVGDIDLSVRMTAPLPNFGLVAMFKLTNWLNLDADIGFFSLQTKTFGGTIYNLNISLLFQATRWLGFNMSYQEFDVSVFFPSNKINTIVNYNFRGPALGVKVNF